MAFIVLPDAKPFVLAIECISPLPELTQFQPIKILKYFYLKNSRDLIGLKKIVPWKTFASLTKWFVLARVCVWLSLARLCVIAHMLALFFLL